MTSPNRPETARRRANRIDEIYGYLNDVVEYVDDHALQDDILDWMEAADDVPASSLLDHIEGVLADFVEYQMYRRHGDGREDFPEACEGCRHYRTACPLFTQRRVKIERARLQDELVDAGEEEVKQKLRQLAGEVGCHVIKDEIARWDEEFADLLTEGQVLRRQTIHLLRPKSEADVVAEEVAETAGVGN